MKAILVTLALFVSAQFASAHALPPIVLNHTRTIELAADYVADTVGYPETTFDSLSAVSSVQDSTRKIRVIKFKFGAANCAKDLEVYTKLDGSAVLSHKVVGCVQ